MLVLSLYVNELLILLFNNIYYILYYTSTINVNNDILA